MKNSASLLYSFVLFVSDFIALIIAFTLAYIVRVKLDDRPLLEPITANGYIGVIAVLLVFWLVIYGILGLYKSSIYENRFKEFLMLLIGSFVGILFLIGTEYVLNRAIFPARLVTAYGFLFAFLLTLLFRTITRAVRRLLYKFDIGVSNVLIIGSTEITTELAQRLSIPHLGYQIVGIVGDKRTNYPNIPDKLKFSNFADAISHLKPFDIHTIVQTELFADQDANDEVLNFAQEQHIAYRFVPGNSRLFVGNIEVNLFEGIPTVAVHQTALIGWGRVVKRIFDVFASSIFLVLLSPLLLIIYGAIKLVDFGPSFYRQERLTRFDAKINILKFRSFKNFSNDYSVDEALDKLGKHGLAKRYRTGDDSVPIDDLLHPLGKFLRKSSLDELPQLFNVLKGDISMVGPRPLVARELQNFDKKHHILSVKPGLTGLAVIAGRRDLPFEERRKLDIYYVQHWSFLLDIVILLKTIVVVVRRGGN